MGEVDRRQGGALGGTVLRGSDGSLYFIRDEVLAAFRVEGEGLERLEDAFAGRQGEGVETVEVQGRATDVGRARQVGFVRGSLLREDSRNIGIELPDVQGLVASTVMCPWFC